MAALPASSYETTASVDEAFGGIATEELVAVDFVPGTPSTTTAYEDAPAASVQCTAGFIDTRKQYVEESDEAHAGTETVLVAGGVVSTVTEIFALELRLDDPAADIVTVC